MYFLAHLLSFYQHKSPKWDRMGPHWIFQYRTRLPLPPLSGRAARASPFGWKKWLRSRGELSCGESSTGLRYLGNLLEPLTAAAAVFDGSDDKDLGAGFTCDLGVGSHSDTGPG